MNRSGVLKRAYWSDLGISGNDALIKRTATFITIRADWSRSTPNKSVIETYTQATSRCSFQDAWAIHDQGAYFINGCSLN